MYGSSSGGMRHTVNSHPPLAKGKQGGGEPIRLVTHNQLYRKWSNHVSFSSPYTRYVGDWSGLYKNQQRKRNKNQCNLSGAVFLFYFYQLTLPKQNNSLKKDTYLFFNWMKNQNSKWPPLTMQCLFVDRYLGKLSENCVKCARTLRQ